MERRAPTRSDLVMITAVVWQLLGPGTAAAGTPPGAAGAEPATMAGSCRNAAGGFCNEFTGASFKPASVQRACRGQKVAYLAGACPAAERVGSCLLNGGKNTESRYRYYTGFPGHGVRAKGGVAAEAERQCARLKGEWTPG